MRDLELETRGSGRATHDSLSPQIHGTFSNPAAYLSLHPASKQWGLKTHADTRNWSRPNFPVPDFCIILDEGFNFFVITRNIHWAFGVLSTKAEFFLQN